MIAHTAVAVSDYRRSKTFYEQALEPLGYRNNMEYGEAAGFNDGKNRSGMEHICHHEANSILIVWLLIALALVIERLYRQRYLHRGEHGVRSAIDLHHYLWLTLGSHRPPDTS